MNRFSNIRRSIVEHSESAFSDDERVVERPARGMAFRVDSESDRPKLHFSDRIVPIAELWCGGEPDEVARLHLGEHSLESNRRKVVAFIDDDMAITGHKVIDFLLTDSHESGISV